MAYQQFIKSTVNPNDTAGGGGCACDPRKQGDCHGPYIVCYGNSMDDHLSPHVVIGAACVDKMHALLHEGEALEAGEHNTIPATALNPKVQATPPRREPPVVESPDPRRDFDDGAPKL